MKFSLLSILIAFSSNLVAQNFAVLHWGGEYSKSLGYSLEEGAPKDSIEIFQFNHLENEASTDFRHFTAYISNGENEKKKLEHNDTLDWFENETISLYYIKESYYVEQQFSFMEDEELEIVGDDFVNSKPDSAQNTGPKKVLEESYYWIGKNKNLKGKVLDIEVQRNTADKKMLEKEKAFLKSFLKDSWYTNFDAYDYYSGLNEPTEKSVFAIMEVAFKSILTNDTLNYNKRLANKYDNDFLLSAWKKPLNKTDGDVDSLAFVLGFNKNYFKFPYNKEDSAHKSLEEHNFVIHAIELGTTNYYVFMQTRISEEEVLQIKLKLSNSSRGIVFRSSPELKINSSFIDHKRQENKGDLSDLNLFVGKPLFVFLNNNANQIRSLEIEEKYLLIKTEDRTVRLKLKGKIKSKSLEEIESLKIKSIEFFTVEQTESTSAINE